MTSETSKKASTEEQDPQKDASVFDFLYHDARRVASFLSQFDKNGSLTSLTRSEVAERSKTDSGKFETSGGVPGVVKASGVHQQDVSAGLSKENAKTYDPLWSNALALLDYLSDREMIERDISSARIGQFLLVKGKLAITDLGIVQRSMELPSIKKLLNIEDSSSPKPNRRHRRTAAAQGAGTQGLTPLDMQRMAFDMLSIMPHTAQARLYTDDDHQVWVGLSAENLVVKAEDLFLKHGVVIGGEWHMLGVIDALPGSYGDPEGALSIFKEIEEDGTGTEMLARILPTFVPFTKIMLGRPEGAFGMTPLMIFREVHG